MNIEIAFQNPPQREFYYSTQRNQCFSGGFNNGKTFMGCFKALTLLTTFPKYRMAICRQVYSDLKRTTMQTFFKMCPAELIESHNWQDGLTVLRNGSQINWMHLDKVELNSLRGLEVNSVLIDQAEETQESTYDVLDARIGRWDGVIVPDSLKAQFPEWPFDRKGKAIVPSYMMLLTNPDTQYHYIYRKYHPNSLERRENYFFTEGEWDQNLGSQETYEEALKKGDEYVQKFVKGIWGLSNAQIHRIDSRSLLDFSPELIDKIQRKGNLSRILDHGDASPTCCLWFANLDGLHICYREYYVPNRVIQQHRLSISELSGTEYYATSAADPQIFKKTAQKEGGFWTVADEYSTRDYDAPPLHWVPADNNEFATRNRINEFLALDNRKMHPVTGEAPAPSLYFIKRSAEYPQGCFFALNETQSQRRELIGYVDGKAVYSDDREKSIADHAYDCVRYYVALHLNKLAAPRRQVKPNSFKWFQMMKKRKDAPAVASA